jgi:O-antigen/teichoic acid export membrane protein
MVATVQRRPATVSSGVRSGAVLAVASAISIVLNYVFLLAAGRVLGSDAYGSLAALLGLLAVVLIPATAIQLAVSREVSRLIASGDTLQAQAFVQRALRASAVATLPLLVVALTLAPLLSGLLNIDSVGMVLLAETTFAMALVTPVAMGAIQGSQRFNALASLYLVPFVLRLAVFAIAAAVGYRLGGAVFATVLSAVAGALLALYLIRDLLGSVPVPSPDLRPFLRYLGPVAIGLIGIALLTHVDLLVVKARFSADDAGAYAGASAFARVGFFLPATILAVLFPRTAARQARGEQTEDILGRSLIATIVFCGGLAVFYAAAGVGLIVASFGPGFAEGGRVLAPFALAIGLFSVANVLVGYHLSRGDTRYAWIVAGAVPVQVLLLALVPTSLRGVVWTNAAVGAALIVAHEVLVGSSRPALRAGLRRLNEGLVPLRAVLPEAGLVLLGTTVFVCVLFWPVVEHLSSTVLGTPGSDSTGGVAFFWELQHEGGYHLLGVTHHTLIAAPFGLDATNAVNIQLFLPYYPTYLAAHVIGEIAALNLTTLAGYVLPGAAMYLLVRYLGCSRLVSAWAVLVYVVFPWHLARLEHASLLHIEVLALFLVALIATARKPSWQRIALVGVANLGCWLTSGYFGAMAAVTSVAFALGAMLVSDRARRVKLLLGTSAVALAPAVVIGIAAVASGTNTGAGLGRQAVDLSAFGLRPVELVVPPAKSWFFGGHLDSFWHSHSHGSNSTELSNYLGLLTIALALGWLVFAFRRRARLSEKQRVATAGLVAVFLAGLLFAAPSPVSVFGHDVWMPSRLLWEALPAFRVISRWDPLLMTALLPLAALGLQAATGALARRRQALAVSIVGAAMVVSFVELSIEPAKPRFRTVPTPSEYSAIERTPPGIVAEYPLGQSDIYRFWQRKYGRPLVNGAEPGTQADYARLVLLDPTQPGTASALAFLGVTAVSLHPGAHADVEIQPRDPAGSSGYRLVARYPHEQSIWYPDGASVWQIVAPPAPALVTLPGGFASPQRDARGIVVYPLVSTAGVGVLDLTARSPELVRLVFDVTAPAGKSATLRVADSKKEQRFAVSGRTAVSVLVAIPRGQSQLLLKTDPPPASPADALLITTPRAQHAFGAPVLHADLVSPNPGLQ